MRCTKALIYRQNIISNLNQIKSVLNKETKICAAVKADGYGSNAVETARTAVKCGAEYLAIATIDEGIELREAGIKANLLLLSLCTPEEIEELLEFNIIPLVYDSEMISKINQAAAEKNSENFKVFLAVDTGMGRIGCLWNEAGKLAEEISVSSKLMLGGVITHFAVSDSISKENIEYTKKQFADFNKAIDEIKKRGIDPGIRTCSSSAGAIAFPEMQMDMVRPGIIVYGYYPDEVTKEYLKSRNIDVELKPVMQFETKVVSIRHFTPGRTVSYGRTWECKNETDIAVLPVGYADGLLRRFSPKLKVSINGKLYPVCGRICMDQCMIDIGLNNPDVKRWDKAIIFGPKDKGAMQDADDLARQVNTISYEVMTSISKRVKREIID